MRNDSLSPRKRGTRISVLHIDKHLLEHLAIRAYTEYSSAQRDHSPDLMDIPWKRTKPIIKMWWRIVAATVITEANNVLKDGIKASDQR